MSAPIIKFGQKTVGAGLSSVTITFAADEQAAFPAQFPAGMAVSVVGVPDWTTSVRISTAPTVTSVTFTFGTATGIYGGILYWTAIGR